MLRLRFTSTKRKNQDSDIMLNRYTEILCIRFACFFVVLPLFKQIIFVKLFSFLLGCYYSCYNIHVFMNYCDDEDTTAMNPLRVEVLPHDCLLIATLARVGVTQPSTLTLFASYVVDMDMTCLQSNVFLLSGLRQR